MRTLGRVGIWTRQLDRQPGAVAEAAAIELEALGYPALWIPEAVHREVLTHAALLLAATRSIVVATGIARVHARSPQACALAQRFLAERFPDRFLLGLGVSHPAVVERALGQTYGPPLTTMRAYLEAMDKTVGGAPVETDATPRVLAALGPRMLALAAERSSGVHSYMAPVAHTSWARDQLGREVLLAPAIKVVLTGDTKEGAAIARRSVESTVAAPAYRENLLRFGFTDTDLDGDVADGVIAALVAVGEIDVVVSRVEEHLAAGADHVCVEVLTGDDTTVPMEAWRRLAAPLSRIG